MKVWCSIPSAYCRLHLSHTMYSTSPGNFQALSSRRYSMTLRNLRQQCSMGPRAYCRTVYKVRLGRLPAIIVCRACVEFRGFRRPQSQSRTFAGVSEMGKRGFDKVSIIVSLDSFRPFRWLTVPGLSLCYLLLELDT